MQELSPKAKVSYDDQKFEVEFDVREFRPEELSIKTDGDVLVVLAKHETKTESGGSFVSKQFEQRFTLPSGVRDAIQRCHETYFINVIDLSKQHKLGYVNSRPGHTIKYLTVTTCL